MGTYGCRIKIEPGTGTPQPLCQFEPHLYWHIVCLQLILSCHLQQTHHGLSNHVSLYIPFRSMLDDSLEDEIDIDMPATKVK